MLHPHLLIRLLLSLCSLDAMYPGLKVSCLSPQCLEGGLKLTPEPFFKLLPLESAKWQILEQMLFCCPWLQR